MRKVKEIANLSDIICENCIYYDGGECNLELPVMLVDGDNRCGDGNWLLDKEVLYIDDVYQKLGDYNLVTNIEDINCNNCIYFNKSQEKCIVSRDSVYDSKPDEWCGEGRWFHKEGVDGKNVSTIDGSSIYSEIIGRVFLLETS